MSRECEIPKISAARSLQSLMIKQVNSPSSSKLGRTIKNASRALSTASLKVSRTFSLLRRRVTLRFRIIQLTPPKITTKNPAIDAI